MNTSNITAQDVKALFDGYNGNNIKTQDTFIDLFFQLVNTPIIAKTASYILALTDRTKLVTMTAAGANTLTVPPNTDVAFPIGSTVYFTNLGAGTTTITAGSGVTIRSKGGLLAATQYSSVTLRKIATNTWTAQGDLA